MGAGGWRPKAPPHVAGSARTRIYRCCRVACTICAAQIDQDARTGRGGAKAFYLACLVPDREIEAHVAEGSPDAPAEAPTATQPQSPDNEAQLKRREQQLVYRIKHAASNWLGLIALDSGDYDVAVSYLGKRTLEADPDGTWTVGARYNLARAHEALGRLSGDRQQLEAARNYYLADEDSPQRHGNRVRARQLEPLLNAAANGTQPPP